MITFSVQIFLHWEVTFIYEQFILHNPLSAYKFVSNPREIHSVRRFPFKLQFASLIHHSLALKRKIVDASEDWTCCRIRCPATPCTTAWGRALSKIPSNAPMRSEKRHGHTKMRSWYLTGAAQRICATQGCTESWRYTLSSEKNDGVLFCRGYCFFFFR